MDEKRLKSLLNFSARVTCFKSIDSTNSEAKRRVKQGESGVMLLIAEEQTDGRGRKGKSFYSPAETGIYMTLVVYPKAECNPLTITSAAAVAVCRAIERYTDLKPEIKWVNDVYIYGKKVCGILTEAVSSSPATIIGIGVNITTAVFPSDVENGGSLGTDIDKTQLAAEIANNLVLLADSEPEAYIPYCRAHSAVTGKRIDIIKNGAVEKATALGIDNNGGLIVRFDDGREETLISGDVSIRRRGD